jgi:hypothetical protein
MPASWRELYTRRLKLMKLGSTAEEIPERLSVSAEQLREIVCVRGASGWWHLKQNKAY